MGLTNILYVSYTALMTLETEGGISGNAEGIILEAEPSERRRIRINPENPAVELRRQSRMWANIVARKLGFSIGDKVDYKAYSETMPKDFGPKPKSFEDLLVPVYPVLVDPRVDLPELLDIVEIPALFDVQKIEDWLTEGRSGIPKEPYATWVILIANISTIQAREEVLKYDDRRGGVPFDGIALFLRDRFFLNEYSFKFPGSQVGPEDAPFLTASPNPERLSPPSNPSLAYGSIETKSPKFASIIASKPFDD